ncbi:DUF4401 domain-containing protein [Vreelandella lutescens]|uniref:DUF4401 domain-containing protein n=1 Tax=Vreelandella lutescens TaxID=1602943 RepID=A0ABQ1NGU4_9GAMM|nr:DUF4401 domain-containing protein [Halomonas lutescens]GGC76867.1 hypothetical protein GCM10011382_03450 [Halomonas lutescens]
MNQQDSPLKQTLTQAGVVLNERAAATHSMPWFVRGVQALSGWLAALFLLGFIATGVVWVLESPLAALLVGGLMVLGAYALLRRSSDSDVMEHMALAFSLAGQLLMAWPLADALSFSAGFGWALVIMQVVLAACMPSRLHRFVAVVLACLALEFALAASGIMQVASSLVVLALVGLWLNEFRWPERLSDMHAWGVGLLVGVLILQGVAHAGQALWLGSFVELDALSPMLSRSISTALAGVALVWVVHTAMGCHSLSRSVTGVAYSVALLVAVLSYFVPGLSSGIAVLLLGVAISHRVLMASGILLLLAAVSAYYYWLDVSLLNKAALLCVLGSVLLALRWGLQRWRLATTKGREQHGH